MNKNLKIKFSLIYFLTSFLVICLTFILQHIQRFFWVREFSQNYELNNYLIQFIKYYTNPFEYFLFHSVSLICSFVLLAIGMCLFLKIYQKNGYKYLYVQLNLFFLIALLIINWLCDKYLFVFLTKGNTYVQLFNELLENKSIIFSFVTYQILFNTLINDKITISFLKKNNTKGKDRLFIKDNASNMDRSEEKQILSESLRTNEDLKYEAYIEVEKLDKKYLIPTNDVYFFKSSGNYVEIFTQNENFLIRATLKNTFKSMTKEFVYIHRSCVINTTYIDELELSYLGTNKVCYVKLNNGNKLKVSRSHISAFEKYLND